MPSSVADFRQYLYRDVDLPSGLSATLRKVQAWDFVGLGELPIPTSAALEGTAPVSPEEALSLQRYTDRAVARGVVAPKMTDARDDGGEPVRTPDCLHVSELLPDDYQALSMAILQWAGLVPEAAKAVDAFRQDPIGATGEGISGNVPYVALADSQG